MKPLNVLIITSSYPPEIRSSAHLMQELAEELKIRGHNICVATSYPKVNISPKIKNISFKTFSTEGGVDIIRIKTFVHPHDKHNFVLRGGVYLGLPYIFFAGIKKHIKFKPDAVIVYSPPLPLALTGSMVKKYYNAKFILNVQDLFPQNAIDLGILSNRMLIKLFESIEKKAYKEADIVTVHSLGNRKFLTRDNRCDIKKLTTLYNWIDINDFDKKKKKTVFRKKFGIENKFIFFFGGIMGPSQGLDLIVKAANELKDAEDIVFLLAGEGLEKKKLENLAAEYKLKNVIFSPFLDKKDYEFLVSEIDAGSVVLSSKNKTPVVPGKLLSYMAAKVPALAFINKESDGHEIIKAANCGYSEVSDNHFKAALLMLKMYEQKDSLNRLGENGFNFARERFSKEVCVNKIEELLSAA